MQILVTTATPVGGVLFQAGDLILHREHEMLDSFGLFLSQIYALFGAFFTGLYSVAVYQNLQISRMR